MGSSFMIVTYIASKEREARLVQRTTKLGKRQSKTILKRTAWSHAAISAFKLIHSLVRNKILDWYKRCLFVVSTWDKTLGVGAEFLFLRTTLTLNSAFSKRTLKSSCRNGLATLKWFLQGPESVCISSWANKFKFIANCRFWILVVFQKLITCAKTRQSLFHTVKLQFPE